MCKERLRWPIPVVIDGFAPLRSHFCVPLQLFLDSLARLLFFVFRQQRSTITIGHGGGGRPDGRCRGRRDGRHNGRRDGHRGGRRDGRGRDRLRRQLSIDGRGCDRLDGRSCDRL